MGTLLDQTWALIARSSWRVVIACLVLTALGVALDLKSDGRSANLLFSIVELEFQWWVTASLLVGFGKRDSSAEGSGSVIGVNFLSGLGILVGLLLLVIPGVVALVRWSMAVPIVLSERNGAMNALRESWYRTEGHFWPILGLLLIIYAPLLVLIMAVGALMPSTLVLTASILENGVLSLMLVAGWHAAVALFLASDPPMQPLEEVFA